MSGLSGLSSSEKWFTQFKPEDRDVARMLLDEVHLVSSGAFSDGILRLIDEVASERSEPDRKIALYSERPIKRVFGNIPAFFPNSRHGRAEGPGVPPVVVNPLDQEVGSEGIVAQLITSYCRANPKIALSHPGPTKLRKDRVSHIVIITDLIGSGDRIFSMLDSFGHVATLRSWQSYGIIKFVIIAYAAADHGFSRLRFAPLKHEVRSVVGCPTIYSAFRGARRDLVYKLCHKYPPRPRGDPFGWRGGGALMAFSHGCPNNAPALLWSSANSWLPIFPGRTALAATEAFRVDDSEMLKARTERLLRTKDIRERLDAPDGSLWLAAMAVLAASEDGARGPKQISARLGIAFGEARTHFALCKKAEWLSDKGRVTLLGRLELKRLRRRLRPKPVFPSDGNPFYYPSQLRAP
ncbi:hypothetical protein [Rhizobium ruizarguesonis]|uniref:phosphoribosyltransferase-like protein n=1 Tax=Rhizobium ruizarguesonis TaxID=2081791 RepID=UPI00371EED1D